MAFGGNPLGVQPFGGVDLSSLGCPVEMVDALNSYYVYVLNQAALVCPSQLFAGLVNARDWPQTPFLEGALYLLYISSTPVGGTESQILYENLCQWVWTFIGTNIQPGQRAQNRGDRFRSNLTTISVLRQANYPSFTQKLSYTADNEGNVTSSPVESVVPVSAPESIWWSRLKFAPRLDNEKSGVTYGAASVRIYAYDDVDPRVA